MASMTSFFSIVPLPSASYRANQILGFGHVRWRALTDGVHR